MLKGLPGSIVLAFLLLIGYWAYRRIRGLLLSSNASSQSSNHNVVHQVEQLVLDKPKEIRTIHALLRIIRQTSGAFLILGLSMFFIGGITHEFELAVLGWILWGVFAFTPLIVDGLDAILVEATAAKPLIYLGKPKLKVGMQARKFGIGRLIVGLIMMILTLLLLSEVAPDMLAP